MASEVTTKTEAQTRVDQIRIFRRELERLRQDGVLALDDAQERAVAAYHDGIIASYARGFDIDQSHQAKQLSLGMRVASFLGALALAASIFFLFYQYWGLFDTTAQVLVLAGAPLVLLVLTLWLAQKEDSGYFARLAAMVLFSAFVLDLSMLGGIFNVTPSDHVFLAWGALAFVLAYALDARLLLAAGIMCLITWFSARMGTWNGLYWLSFGARPENFLLAGILLFVLPGWIDQRKFDGFDRIYRVFGLLALLLPVLVLANNGLASYLVLDAGLVERLYQLAGFILSAGVIGVGIRRDWPEVVNTGNVFFVIFLYTKFYDWWWDAIPKYLFFLLIGLTAILFLVVFKRLRGVANRADRVVPA